MLIIINNIFFKYALWRNPIKQESFLKNDQRKDDKRYKSVDYRTNLSSPAFQSNYLLLELNNLER